MKIGDLIYFKELFIKEKEDFFQEGNLIEGEILEIEEEFISIDVKDFGIIKAKSERPLNKYKGKILNFVIKESSPNRIKLKPILDNINLKESSYLSIDRDKYVLSILKEFNIKPSYVSMDLLDNLMKFNLPINKENLIYGVGVLDKFEQLSNVKKEEMVILADSSKDVIDIEKEDIRNLIIIENTQHTMQSDYRDYKEDIDIAINQLDNYISKDEIHKDLLKTIIVFMKYNIKPTLNNIKYFLEINENFTLFSKDFEILKKIMDNKFTNHLKRIMISNGGLRNSAKEINSRYEEILNKILEYLKNNSLKTNEEINKGIEELIDKVEFIREMNKEIIFIYLPINLDKEIKDTLITLINKRKKEIGYKNKINIFINLNTKKLGNIKIHCQIYNSNIDIKFSGISNEDIDLFKSNEYELKDLVEITGYKINAIEYLSKNDYTILDSLSVHINTRYNLDVQV